ncbi:MAG TPA: hypothetical protein VKW06_14855 [Candidatus Angelobacter sp.]|nr:hypothetical protein [Candidatus Angelobacter sp.]
MSLLSLLLLISMGPPQDYQIQPLTNDQVTQGMMLSQAQHAAQLDRNQIRKLESGDNTCFAIRSYIFRREDGDAPELIGSTTCTPASAFRSRRIGHPRGRLVPLGFVPSN